MFSGVSRNGCPAVVVVVRLRKSRRVVPGASENSASSASGVKLAVEAFSAREAGPSSAPCDARNEDGTGRPGTEGAGGRSEGPLPDERGVGPPSVLRDQASTPTASLASEASWVCAAPATFARLLWVSS